MTETNLDGCTGEPVCLDVEVGVNTGLHEASNVELSLFPNPSQGRLTIQSNQALLNMDGIVSNAAGPIVSVAPLSQLNQSINGMGLK